MGKVKKNVVVEASQSEESSPLPELANKKKANNGNTAPAAKAKPIQKKPVPQDQSDEDTPVQDKKKPVKAPRKGSKASVDEEVPAPKGSTRKGSVDKPAAKKPVAKKDESSEESSEQIVAPPKGAAKAASKPVAAQKNKKKETSSEESSEEIVSPPKKTTPVVQPKDKKEAKQVKQIAKKQSSSDEQSEEIVAPPKKTTPAVQPKQAAKKPVKPVESEQSEQQSKPKQRKASKQIKPAPKKQIKKVQKSEDESEQQSKPKTRKASKDIKVEPKKKTLKKESESEEEEEQPTKKKPAAKKVEKKVESEEEEEEKPAPKRKASGDITKKAVAKKEEPKVEEEEQGEFEVAVQGLSFNAFDGDVRELFNECGNILNIKMISRPDGKPKGFAFVKFSTRSARDKALELNGVEHMGRAIRVEEARGKQERPDTRGGNQQQPGTAVIQTPTLFVGGLSYNSSVESMKEFFAAAGQVQSARIVTDKESGKPRGFGYVEFYDVDTAKKAYQELNGQYLDGRQIRLDSAAQRDRPQNGGGFGGNRQGGFGGGFNRGGNTGNRGNSAVELSQNDRNAKKGAIAGFAGKKIEL